MNVQMAYNLFLVDRESYCSDKSILYYRENILKFMNFLSDRLGLAPDLIGCDVISRELVLAYLSQLRGTGCKNTSVNTYFRAAKVFLNYCIDEGYSSPDVLRKVKFLKKDNAPVLPLTEWEVDLIDGLFNIKTESGLRNLCIVHLMLDAGFRVGDVISLTFKGINFQLFSRIKRKSGIERVHPHLLRHTFATSFIVGGGDLEYLRMMLGHTDYATTKMYVHIAQQSKMLHSDIYRLDSVFFKTGY